MHQQLDSGIAFADKPMPPPTAFSPKLQNGGLAKTSWKSIAVAFILQSRCNHSSFTDKNMGLVMLDMWIEIESILVRSGRVLDPTKVSVEDRVLSPGHDFRDFKGLHITVYKTLISFL